MQDAPDGLAIVTGEEIEFLDLPGDAERVIK